jgi:hypothetical protein
MGAVVFAYMSGGGRGAVGADGVWFWSWLLQQHCSKRTLVGKMARTVKIVAAREGNVQ